MKYTLTARELERTDTATLQKLERQWQWLLDQSEQKANALRKELEQYERDIPAFYAARNQAMLEASFRLNPVPPTTPDHAPQEEA